jgi:hypothetical protein
LNVDWESHLEGFDLVWSWTNESGSGSRPNNWVDSSFVGNGMLGAYMFEPTPQMWRVELSRMDVYDDRTSGSFVTKNFVLDTPRLPIGHLELSLAGPDGSIGIVAAAMRMHLYNGIVTASVLLSGGCNATMTMLASANFGEYDVIAMETSWNEQCGAAVPLNATFVPDPADSTWAPRTPSYVHNPPAVVTVSAVAGVPGATNTLAVQDHLQGTAHATSFTVVPAASGYSAYIAISPVVATHALAGTTASGLAAVSATAGFEAVRSGHSAWWNAFWPEGAFITDDNTWMMSFWTIQWYKYASASRAERGVVMDLEGPWFVPGTGWPDVHHDMNIQMQHYSPLSADRLDLFQPYIDSWLRAFEAGHLSGNLPAGWGVDSIAAPTGASAYTMAETCYWDYGPNCTTSPPSITGNMLWILQIIERRAAVTANSTMLSDVLFPMLRQAVNFYSHFEINHTTTADGRTHLPETFSPEFMYRGPDTNYDLQLYRWGLTTVIDLVKRGLGQPHPEELLRWTEELDTLVPYPVDDNGLMIAHGVPLNVSHRHFSHLMTIWPLRTLNFSDPLDLDLAITSVDHWVGLPGALTGFCRPAMSQMSVQFGRREAAFTNISFLLNDWMKPNTFYTEGPNGPCTETPYSATYAMQALLLSSYNGTQRIFPGVDDASMPNAAFYGLRGEGAFLISAKRENNATRFVAVESEAGSPLIIEADMPAPWSIAADASAGSASIVALPPVLPNMLPRYEVLGLPARSTAVLYPTGNPVGPDDVVISPAAGCPADLNYWGMRPKAEQPVPIELSPCGNGTSPSPAQTFDLVNATVGNNTGFQLKLRGSESGAQGAMCIGTARCGTADSTVVSLTPCAGVDPQPGCHSVGCGGVNTVWAWSPATPFPDRLRLPYATTQQGANMCMGVPGAIGPEVTMWTCDNHVGAELNEEWTWIADTGVMITQVTTQPWNNNCLTVSGSA